MEFAAQIRQVSGIDLSRFIAFTNLDEQEQETAIANVLAEFPDKNAKWAKKELCRVLKTYNSGKKKMEGNFLRYGTKMKPKGV
jgi:hypothetical protein